MDTEDFLMALLKFAVVVLLFVGFIALVINISPDPEQQAIHDHPGCQRIDIELHGAPGHDLNGYGWICPTPTEGK